jgi:large subunit ribosomal protein L23
MSKRIYANILLAPLVSEKASRQGDKENSVAFWVNPKASKLEIKKAVETFFPDVKVESVRTMVKGRNHVSFGQIEGRTKKKKKAYVKLAAGKQINFAELEK